MNSGSVLPAQQSAPAIRSRIVEWDLRRGFGYVEHAGKRLFLHRRDFIQKSHAPRIGDAVSFILGIDQKGRSCARAAQFLHQRGFLRFRDLVGLLFLLVLPGLATMCLPWSPWFSLAYLVVVSGLSYWDYRDDKIRATGGEWRVSESSLHFLGFIGGWPGGFLGQKQFRHKTAKASYQFVFWSIVLLHEAAALDFLLGWPAGRRLVTLLADLISHLPA